MTKNADGTPDRARQTKAIGSFSVSLALYGMAASLFLEGRLTPTARNSGERRAMQEARIPEGSLEIGGRWLQLNGYDPFTTYMTTMANVMRIVHEWDEEQDDESTIPSLIVETVSTVANSVLSESWAQGLREGLDALTSDDGSAWRRVAESYVKSFNPIQPHYNNFTKTNILGMNPFYDDVMKQIEWYPFKTKPRLDTYGEPILVYDSTFGVRHSESTDSPIRKEVVRLGISLSPVPTSHEGVRLTEDQRYKVLSYMGEVLQAEATMNEQLSKESYATLSFEDKKHSIRTKWNTIQKKALDAVLGKDLEFIQKRDEWRASTGLEVFSGHGYKDEWFK